MIIFNAILILLNLYLLVKPRIKFEYFKEGIRIKNKKGEVVVEYDKPLKK